MSSTTYFPPVYKELPWRGKLQDRRRIAREIFYLCSVYLESRLPLCLYPQQETWLFVWGGTHGHKCVVGRPSWKDLSVAEVGPALGL